MPIYDVTSPHPDPILHAKLKDNIDLLRANVDYLTEHFYGSRFSYSTQALPVNVLLDTLIRPYGETDEAERKTCVKWMKDPSRTVQHIVVGQPHHAGGQWADNPVKASWDIGALSYAGMLSLPGYSFEEYYLQVHCERPPFYLRPTRRDVAGYFARYPQMVGVTDSIFSGTTVSDVSRTANGFYIGSHGISCKHLILASGTFTKLIPPRPLLHPLANLGNDTTAPILVVGSGFSAADVILSTPRSQKVIHIYKWAPRTNPSPLKACHEQAYPEYAGVYRKMKSAALSRKKSDHARRPVVPRTTSQLDSARDWQQDYEGMPNTAIVDVEVHADHAMVTLKSDDDTMIQRKIGAFAYVVGRRGSLSYLSQELRNELAIQDAEVDNITGQTLRDQISEDLEVAPHVYITGSLTGDSLIRFAYGACAYAAGRILADKTRHFVEDEEFSFTWKQSAKQQRPLIATMNGLQGHEYGGLQIRDDIAPLDRRKSEIYVEGY